jgi:hypothetical protein
VAQGEDFNFALFQNPLLWSEGLRTPSERGQGEALEKVLEKHFTILSHPGTPIVKKKRKNNIGKATY